MTTKPRVAEEENHRIGQPGIPIDSRGGPTIDPTKNVLDLVRAESKYQDAMRDSAMREFNSAIGYLRDQIKLMSDNADRFQTAQRDAETKRIDQLAQNRQEFQNTIRDMLAESVRTTSTLVSTQLVQIQATFDTRVSKLEAYQFTQAGKASVSDPQITETMVGFQRSITAFQATTSETMAKSSMATAEAIAKLTVALSAMQTSEGIAGGRLMGREQGNARLLAIVMAVAAVASPVIAILVTIMTMRGGVH